MRNSLDPRSLEKFYNLQLIKFQLSLFSKLLKNLQPESFIFGHGKTKSLLIICFYSLNRTLTGFTYNWDLEWKTWALILHLIIEMAPAHLIAHRITHILLKTVFGGVTTPPTGCQSMLTSPLLTPLPMRMLTQTLRNMFTIGNIIRALRHHLDLVDHGFWSRLVDIRKQLLQYKNPLYEQRTGQSDLI